MHIKKSFIVRENSNFYIFFSLRSRIEIKLLLKLEQTLRRLRDQSQDIYQPYSSLNYINKFSKPRLENFRNPSIPVVLNRVGGTEPHKFHTCIHRTLRSCWSFFSANSKHMYINVYCISAQTCVVNQTGEPLKLTHRTPGLRSNPG